MSTTIDTKFFISRVINKCSIVSSSKLDKTIKALINNYKARDLDTIIDYLNKLRVIYYLKRLEYRDSLKAKEYKGKYIL